MVALRDITDIIVVLTVQVTDLSERLQHASLPEVATCRNNARN